MYLSIKHHTHSLLGLTQLQYMKVTTTVHYGNFPILSALYFHSVYLTFITILVHTEKINW